MFNKIADPQDSPLAIRLRPRNLDELIGQKHLLKPGSPLQRLVEGTDKHMNSVILYGPPGTGKTTLAKMIAHSNTRSFVELSAVNAGVKDIRETLTNADKVLKSSGRQTVLFIDEVHRFSKTQQDALLPAVETGLVILVAATTENPSFSVVSPLLSRSIIISLRSLEDKDIRDLLNKAITDPRGFNDKVKIEEEALEALIRLSSGDARKALTYLEASYGVVGEDGLITKEAISTAIDKVVERYDRGGDSHYDVASAFIKSIRGSDPDASLHWLARMLEAGEDPRFIARRLIISASEDIGLADSNALVVAVAGAQAVALIGMPEARITLAHVTVYLAMAPKSNASYLGLGEAIKDLDEGKGGAVPAHLRDAHSGSLRDEIEKRNRLRNEYKYPHDYPNGIIDQQYLPDSLEGTIYYRPTQHGNEAKISLALEQIKKRLNP